MRIALLISLFLFILCLSHSAEGQENIGKKLADVRSPEVAADNTVTFNLIAP